MTKKIKEAQGKDPEISEWKKVLEEGSSSRFTKDEENILRYEGRLCVPTDEALRREILDEAHKSAYTVHPGATKIYHDLKQVY